MNTQGSHKGKNLKKTPGVVPIREMWLGKLRPFYVSITSELFRHRWFVWSQSSNECDLHMFKQKLPCLRASNWLASVFRTGDSISNIWKNSRHCPFLDGITRTASLISSQVDVWSLYNSGTIQSSLEI
jgi:hypothetical protein